MTDHEKLLVQVWALKNVVSVILGAHFAKENDGEKRLNDILNSLKMEVSESTVATVSKEFAAISDEMQAEYSKTIDSIEDLARAIIRGLDPAKSEQ